MTGFLEAPPFLQGRGGKAQRVSEPLPCEEPDVAVIAKHLGKLHGMPSYERQRVLVPGLPVRQ